MSKPKVSIITIAYNAAETIEATIQSVVEQDYPNIEYIIVDGGSTDETMSIVSIYQQHIASAISEKDEGLYDAMNKGIARSTGEFIGILNADDIYATDDIISQVVEKIHTERADGLYANLKYVDRLDVNKTVRTWIAGAYKHGAFKKGWMPPHPTFFVKRELYIKLGNYNTSFKSSADYDLMLRFIHKHKIKVAYLNEFVTLMRTGGQSNITLKNRLRANKEDRLAWRINGLGSGLLPSIRKPLSKISQFLRKK